MQSAVLLLDVNTFQKFPDEGMVIEPIGNKSRESSLNLQFALQQPVSRKISSAQRTILSDDETSIFRERQPSLVYYRK